jgi:transcriptional regulator with XRE-family HTH domain
MTSIGQGTHKTTHKTTMGDMIRVLRKRNKWSQTDLGEQAGLSRQCVSLIELNQCNVLVETVMRIANALDVSPVGLLRLYVETHVIQIKRQRKRQRQVYSF